MVQSGLVPHVCATFNHAVRSIDRRGHSYYPRCISSQNDGSAEPSTPYKRCNAQPILSKDPANLPICKVVSCKTFGDSSNLLGLNHSHVPTNVHSGWEDRRIEGEFLQFTSIKHVVETKPHV